MATKHNSKCLKNAGDDEPIFVLRASDVLTPGIVREWAHKLGDRDGNPDKVSEALQLADEMEAWQNVNGSKLPD